jgi:hypothetical protein
MRLTDEALELLLQDAADQGLTLAEYERQYGIILPDGKFPNPAQARIRRNEVAGGLMSDPEYARARHRSRRYAESRGTG